MRRRLLLRAIPALASLPVLGHAGRSSTGIPLASPPPLRPGSQVAAVAPGTWWEEPEAEAQRLRQRLRDAGWELERGSAMRAGQRWRQIGRAHV